MEEIDKIFLFGMMVIVLLILFVGFFIVIDYNLTKGACEDLGMKRTGQGDCREGNEYYEVYNKDFWGLDKGVNKHPKTER